MQNFSYNTNWKNGQPNVPRPKDNKNKMTLDPLSKNSINLVDDPEFTTEPIWCFVCQLPHALESCAIALSFLGNQILVEEFHEHEENNDDVGCNMFESHYDHSNSEDCENM